MVFLSANLSLMYRDLPVLERIGAARRDGFRDVETWWPFASAVPEAAEVDEFLAALDAAGVTLRGLNFYAGDMANGWRGVLSHPDAVAEFRGNVAVVRRIAEATGCRHFNALYGKRAEGVAIDVQDDVAAENLAFAASALADLGGVVLLEALKSPDNGDYPLLTLDDAEAVRRRVAAEHGQELGLLFDTFHLAGNGVDLLATIERHAAAIRHVQYADLPGRGAPGTGDIDFPAVTAALAAAGYDGFIGCEFVAGPEPTTLDDVALAIGAAVQA